MNNLFLYDKLIYCVIFLFIVFFFNKIYFQKEKSKIIIQDR